MSFPRRKLPADGSLNFPPRVQHALEENGIFTVHDLMNYSLPELLLMTERARRPAPGVDGQGTEQFYEQLKRHLL